MKLPEQITEEELREELTGRLSGLDRQLEDPQIPEITLVEGGGVVRQAQGRAEIRATGERVCPVSKKFYRINITWENLPATELEIKTTPARLIKTDEHWRQDGFKSDWKRRHELPMPEENSLTASFLVPGRALTVDRPRPRQKRREGAGYHIPPLATHIRGEGDLVYWTGQEVRIRGEHTLGRPAADGSLRVRPGGIYATFYGSKAPEVKLGNTWIQAQPIS